MKVKAAKAHAVDGTCLSVTVGTEYEVLGIEAGYYRILNDPDTCPYGNDAVLFDPAYFEITDPTEPSFWECSTGTEGERYCYPPEWNDVGFFEDYHDGIEEVKKRFLDVLRQLYPFTWQERFQ